MAEFVEVEMRAAPVVLGLLVGFVVASTLPGTLSLTQPAAAAGTFSILSDTFEGAFPGTTWNVTDTNPASGLDYWGINSSRAHSGTHSLWCAQVGTSSTTGHPNAQDGVYDSNMTARLRYWLPGLGGISNITLTFWAWWSIGTGASFSVQAGASGTWLSQWSTGPGTSNNQWVEENLTISVAAAYLDFYFFSGASGGGIGAFVDDIQIVATDYSPPTILHVPVTSAVVGQPISINATIIDNVAVASATLYYEGVGESAFASLPMSPRGIWHLASIPAQASAGTVEYYIVASDTAGNTVSSPSAGASNAYAISVQAAPVPTPGLLWEVIGLGAIILAAALALVALALRSRRAKARSGGGGFPAGSPGLPPRLAGTTGAPETPGLCPACGLQNDPTAIYCNRCATRVR